MRDLPTGWTTACLLLFACGGHGDGTWQPGSTPGIPALPDPYAPDSELCRAPAPEAWTDMDLLYPGEEFAFSDDGRLTTAADWASSVYAMDRGGDWTLLRTYQSDELAGVDFTADQALLVCDEAGGVLVALERNGNVDTVLGSITSPNSVVVSNDRTALVTAYDALLRVDLDTRDSETLAVLPGQDLDGLALSPDFATLWFNSDETGDVYRLRLDVPDAEPELVASLPVVKGESELDGMTTDACGNVYALRTDGRISRIRADGEVERNWVDVGGDYVSALHFGSGIGGWESDHLYVMDRYGKLQDVPVGIPGAPEPHLKR